MSAMHTLSSQYAGRVDLSRLDLPRPNVYWVTVTFHGGETHNLHMAAEHTTTLMRKVSHYGAAHFGTRPLVGNCIIKSKRLSAIELLNYPKAWENARQAAAQSNDRDTIAALDRIPGLIEAYITHKPTPLKLDHTAAEALWHSVGEELDRIGAPVRVLR